MNKSYYCLGLMSGTSGDGVDASVIKSDGENKFNEISNFYRKYDQKTKSEILYAKGINLHSSINLTC